MASLYRGLKLLSLEHLIMAVGKSVPGEVGGSGAGAALVQLVWKVKPVAAQQEGERAPSTAPLPPKSTCLPPTVVKVCAERGCGREPVVATLAASCHSTDCSRSKRIPSQPIRL